MSPCARSASGGGAPAAASRAATRLQDPHGHHEEGQAAALERQHGRVVRLDELPEAGGAVVREPHLGESERERMQAGDGERGGAGMALEGERTEET